MLNTAEAKRLKAVYEAEIARLKLHCDYLSRDYSSMTYEEAVRLKAFYDAEALHLELARAVRGTDSDGGTWMIDVDHLRRLIDQEVGGVVVEEHARGTRPCVRLSFDGHFCHVNSDYSMRRGADESPSAVYHWIVSDLIKLKLRHCR